MIESNGSARGKELAKTYIAKLAEFVEVYGDDREEFCRLEGMHDIVTAIKALHDAHIDPFKHRPFKQLCVRIAEKFFGSRHAP